ncbi:MAG: WD40 repeat domain-containing protein [Gemmataceae bacterium]
MNTPKKPAAPKQIKVVKLDRQMCVLRFNNDGKILAAGGQDAKVRRLDAATLDLKPLAPLIGHSGWVTALAFHPDGKRLLTGDSWGRLSCWPFAEAAPKPLWSIAQAHDGWLRSLSLRPDGACAATGGADGKVRIWSSGDGKKQREVTASGVEVYSVVYHPDGKSLVSGDAKAAVKQWDMSSGKIVRELDARSMYGVFALQELGGARVMCFDAKGTTLAVGGALGGSKGLAGPCITLFDWASGKAMHKITLPGKGYVQDLAFHADGFFMAVTNGSPGQGMLLFVRPGEEAPFFQKALPNPHSLALHPGGKRLIVSAINGGSNGNGRKLGKNKEYPGNYSPLYVYDLPS